jgi:hypothetical protein
MVYQARKGNRLAAGQFADAMYCPLRPETRECFQRSHGFRPVSHRDWFYAKLVQFLDILVHDELTIEEPNGQPRTLLPDELLDEQFKVVGSARPGKGVQPNSLGAVGGKTRSGTKSY